MIALALNCGSSSVKFQVLAIEGEDMGWCGFLLDPALSAVALGRESLVSGADSCIEAWVIPTKEEWVIARETARCLGSAGCREEPG